MSDTASPIRNSFASAHEAVFYQPGSRTITLNEWTQAPSITSAVYFYNIPQEAARLRRDGLEKHVATEFGNLPYTSVSTKIRHEAPPPIAVHMAGFLPGSQLTYTYRTKAIAYLGEQREAAGRTTSIVVGMDTGQKTGVRRPNLIQRGGPSNELGL